MAKSNITSLTEKQLEQILANKQSYSYRQIRKELRTLNKDCTLNDIIDYLVTQQRDFKKQGILK